MLHTVKALKGDHILAEDGDVGAMDDLYFDDRRWGVRFLVVATRASPGQRKVMIAPHLVDAGQLERPRVEDAIRVRMTRAQVERSPDAAGNDPERSHLLSSAELIGYALEAPDGEVGRVEDFVVDPVDWAIADMVVDTTGGRVLVPPSAVSDIDRRRRKVRVRLSCDEVRNATPLD